MIEFCRKLRGYKPVQIYNQDETGLRTNSFQMYPILRPVNPQKPHEVRNRRELKHA